MRDKDHITSLERGLRILEIFGESPRPLTLTEVSNQAKLTKTTTQRFINTLTSLGYLTREENKRYFLGTKILSLGFRFLNSSNLVTMAKPYLDELSSEVDMTVNLAVLDNCDVLILHRKEVRQFFKFDIHPGTKLLAYGSALGRVLLAGLSDADIDNRLSAMNIHQVTPKTIASKEAIMKQIREARKTGYAISDQEQTMDLCSIAVPLVSEQRRTVAAINVSLDAIRRGNSDTVDRAKEKLFEKGGLISRHLGYTGVYPKIFSESSGTTQGFSE
jgi:IclR family pca regulon transcriptional regulator